MRLLDLSSIGESQIALAHDVECTSCIVNALEANVLVDAHRVLVLCERPKPDERHKVAHLSISESVLGIRWDLAGRCLREAAMSASIHELHVGERRSQKSLTVRLQVTGMKYDVVIPRWKRTSQACIALNEVSDEFIVRTAFNQREHRICRAARRLNSHCGCRWPSVRIRRGDRRGG